MLKNKFYYKCIDCGAEYSAIEIKYLCPSCNTENSVFKPPKGVLKILYNYDFIKAKGKKELNTAILNYNYFDLLPIQNQLSLPNLRVGQTPVYNVSNTAIANHRNLFVKDDSQNPTYSLKDRASALVSAFAKEHGITTIAAASTGNAGSSLAGICAAQHQCAIVFVPAKAPMAKLTQIKMYGAQLIPINGTYDDAYNLSIKASKEFGWFNRNTAYNPLTIEGKKTISFEIYHQFYNALPDYVFVPVGDGVILSGIYKGFEDLLKLGLIDKIPTLVAVQAAGSNNLISNILSKEFTFNNSKTVADSISVNIPRNFYMAQKYINKYAGKYVEVNDDEIIDAAVLLAKNTGLFTEPASAASYAGFKKFNESGKINRRSKSLLILTGSGLKDLSAVNQELTQINAIECNIESVKKLFQF